MAEEGSHRWTFFRAGGFDQACLDTAGDLAHLGRLDLKLWAALACPVKGNEFDERTLALIDGDGDARIRAPEVVAAFRAAALEPLLGKGKTSLTADEWASVCAKLAAAAGPFAERRSPWPALLKFALAAGFLFSLLNWYALVHEGLTAAGVDARSIPGFVTTPEEVKRREAGPAAKEVKEEVKEDAAKK